MLINSFSFTGFNWSARSSATSCRGCSERHTIHTLFSDMMLSAIYAMHPQSLFASIMCKTYELDGMDIGETRFQLTVLTISIKEKQWHLPIGVILYPQIQ